MLARALDEVLHGRQQSSALNLTQCNGEHQSIVHILAVGGHAQDVFQQTAALVAVTPIDPTPEPPIDLATKLVSAFHLTPAESLVGALVACGWSAEAIARRLGCGLGTARNHIKSILRKAGTARQTELVALINRALV